MESSETRKIDREREKIQDFSSTPRLQSLKSHIPTEKITLLKAVMVAQVVARTSDFGSRGPEFDSHREPRHCSSIGPNKVAVWCHSTDVVRITPQPEVTGWQ